MKQITVRMRANYPDTQDPINVANLLEVLRQLPAEAQLVSIQTMLDDNSTHRYDLRFKTNSPVLADGAILRVVCGRKLWLQQVDGEVLIQVNGHIVPFVGTEVTYEDVVNLADKKTGHLWTVTYGLPDGGGSLTPGKKITVRPGMVFNVVDTSRA